MSNYNILEARLVIASLLMGLGAAQALQAQDCGRLHVPSDATVVLVGGYEGSAISTHSAGAQIDTTFVIDIRVELGIRPIFLMLDSFRPAIWRVSGNTARLAGVGIDGTTAGIIGIPAENVQYYNSVLCDLDIWKGFLPDNARETRAIIETLRMSPDIVLSGYEIGLVYVPSGKMPNDYRYPGARPPYISYDARQVERDLLRFSPGGVVEIDASLVVSNADISTYDVLPEEAGLAQLVESGAIQPTGLRQYSAVDGWSQDNHVIAIRTSTGQVIRLQGGDDLIDDDGLYIRVVGGGVERSFIGERTYILRESIDVPIGLDGAHSVTFLLPEGVLPPRGNLEGSELHVLSE